MKKIGIVGRVYYNKDNQEIIQLNDYLRRVLVSYEDVIPILLLPLDNISYNAVKDDKIDGKRLNYLLDMCDAFIVPGGTNWYNFDEYVIRYATLKKKPLLAICLGFQCLCSMYSEYRNKKDMTKRLTSNSHYGLFNEYRHSVKIEDNTKLKSILNKDYIMVNSLHYDYIDIPLKELIVSSYSDDNIIEAVELKGHPFFIGLQWHPEYLDDDNSKKIFDSFINSIK